LVNAVYSPSLSTTTHSTNTRGTLIVNIWDAAKKELIWRGAAEAVVKEEPEKAAKRQACDLPQTEEEGIAAIGQDKTNERSRN
jgi:hypothetical protein